MWLHSFFNLGAVWDMWLTPRPGRFTSWNETRYPLCRRLGGPQGWSGRVRKISPPQDPNPGSFSPQQVAIPTELYPGRHFRTMP